MRPGSVGAAHVQHVGDVRRRAARRASERSMRPPPSPSHANVSCSTSKNTGSRNAWIQPPSGGSPHEQAEQRPRGWRAGRSGTVMTCGDSWMWCCTSAAARLSPQKVRNMRRNMKMAVRKRRDDADHPDHVVAADEGAAEDLVLGPEAGEREDADHGQGADEHRPEGDRHLLAQTAHLAHVLLAAHGVDHRARAEEQQALEEAVGEQVEDAGHPGPGAQRHEHEAQRRDRWSRRSPS